MTLDQIKKTLLLFASAGGFELQLVRISSAHNATCYANCCVRLTPANALSDFIKELVRAYIDGKDAKLKKYTSVSEYDGTAEQTIIYSLPSESQLIETEYRALIQSIATPEAEAKVVEFKADAYVIFGCIENEDGTEIPVKIFSMQKPVSRLKNRFGLSNDTFKRIDEPVLNMRPAIDVLVVDKEVFFFNMSGENLFKMERSHKALSAAYAQDIVDCGIITDDSTFKTIAASGANPRRFVSFDKNRLEQLKHIDMRRTMAAKFKISLDDDGFIKTDSKESAEKLIKLLCKKGMVDPFEDKPVEVSGARTWQ